MSISEKKRRHFAVDLFLQFLLYAIPIGLATGLTVYFFYHLDVSMSEEDIRHTEGHHLEMRDELLTQSIEQVASDVRILREMVAAHSEDITQQQTDYDQEEAIEHFEIYCREHRRYHEFRIIREDGKEDARVECHQGQPVVKTEYLERENLSSRDWKGILDLEIGDVWISDIAIAPAVGSSGEWLRPVVGFASVLSAEIPSQRKFVVASVGLRSLISDLLIDTGEGGTMMLVDRRGTIVGRPKKGSAYQAEDQWWGVRFEERFPTVWKELWHREYGELETDDGLFSFVTLHPIRVVKKYQAKVEGYYISDAAIGSGSTAEPLWKVISHVPKPELIEGRQKFAQKFILLIPILLIVPLLGSWYLAHNAVKRRHVVHELADNERYLRQIVDSVLDGIVTTFPDGEIERKNAPTEKIFKFGESDKEITDIKQLIPRESMTNPLVWDGKGLALPLRMEMELKRLDGSAFPAELMIMESQLGGQRRLIWVVRDITERRALEMKQETERMRFFHQTKMAEVGMLAAGIIHEVGNPIAAIQGLIDDLKRRSQEKEMSWDEQSKINLELIQEQARRLSGITRDISDYVRYRPGEEGLYDINGVVRSVARLVRYDSRWKYIDLSLDLDSSVPALRGVEDQITQVLMNLLVNAADAVQGNEPGQRLVEICTRLSGNNVILTVKDNGHGLDEETLAHAFDSFYTTKPEGKGTGLGLSLCRSIVAEHNGLITVESIAGAGALFRIVFPTEITDSVKSA